MNTVELTKIVFTGSIAAGKSTAINTISAIGNTTKNTSEAISSTMDYGQLYLPNSEKLDLYGTLGDRRFSFMSATLCQGALGIIILINNTHKNPFDELDYYLNLNANFLTKNPAIIGVTHYDEVNTPSIENYQSYLQQCGNSSPVIHVDVRKANEVAVLINALLLAREYA
ncbi:MAG: GTP-binding protein [Methylococcales bacterium]|nr:GTP-binding protein [Methylococcales bacterium]